MPDFGDLSVRAGELGVRLAVAVAVVATFVVLGRVSAPVVRRILDRRGRPSYTRVFGGLYRVVVAVVGSLFALTLAFPSVRVADVLAIFGIVSVAAGFAFKDTFENLLAGVLLLLRDPFKSGDQVVVGGGEGTVEGVTVRETLIRGYDGRRYFVPNAKVMTNVIEVPTHEPTLRQTLELHIDRSEHIPMVRSALARAMETTDGVMADPRPEVVLTNLTGGDVVVECRFWSSSRRSDVTGARDRVIEAVVGALDSEEVAPPMDELRVRLSRDEEASNGGTKATT